MAARQTIPLWLALVGPALLLLELGMRRSNFGPRFSRLPLPRFAFAYGAAWAFALAMLPLGYRPFIYFQFLATHKLCLRPMGYIGPSVQGESRAAAPAHSPAALSPSHAELRVTLSTLAYSPGFPSTRAVAASASPTPAAAATSLPRNLSKDRQPAKNPSREAAPISLQNSIRAQSLLSPSQDLRSPSASRDQREPPPGPACQAATRRFQLLEEYLSFGRNQIARGQKPPSPPRPRK